MKAQGSKLVFTMMLLCSLALSTSAQVPGNWVTNQITSNSFGLYHVIYGGGRYVAVGQASDTGAIYSSEDGIQWTLRATDPSAFGLGMTYGSGKFAGMSSFGIFAKSTNGIDWSLNYIENSLPYIIRFSELAINGFAYVAVGNSNDLGVAAIAISSDGNNWAAANLSSAGGPLSGIAFGSSRFVAIGNNDGFVYVSSNIAGTGLWTRYPIPGGSQISYSNGRFIVPLNSGSNLISSDGINWDTVSTGLTNKLRKISYVHGIHISTAGGYFATSSDGTNWMQYANPLPSNAAFSAAASAVASDGTRVVNVGLILVSTPAYYNGFTFTSELLIGIRMTNNPPRSVVLSGLAGRNYQIQSTDVINAGSTNWTTNATFQLSTPDYVWTDAAATNSQRFYRAVLLP